MSSRPGHWGGGSIERRPNQAPVQQEAGSAADDAGVAVLSQHAAFSATPAGVQQSWQWMQRSHDSHSSHVHVAQQSPRHPELRGAEA